MNKSTETHGVSVLGVLLIVFIVLKLVGVISWSWWVVLIPLWISIGLVIIGILAIAAIRRRL